MYIKVLLLTLNFPNKLYRQIIQNLNYEYVISRGMYSFLIQCLICEHFIGEQAL